MPGEPIRTQRADIVDRNGAILATNIVTASLYAQPQDLIDPKATAVALAKIFPDLDAKKLAARVHRRAQVPVDQADDLAGAAAVGA